MTDRQVTVGFDGSTGSVRALDQAAAEAARRGAALRVVYAVPDRDEAGPVLAGAASRVHRRHPGLPVTAEAAEDDAVRALLRAGGGALLLVVGSRGLGGFSGPLLRSVGRRLAGRTHGPLLVVRGDRPHAAGRDVLLGLGNDPEADAHAAGYAFQEARRRGASLHVVHAARPAAPAHALLEATRRAAVVVTGRAGPLAHTLLHRSHCPVLVVPAGV